MCRNEKVYGAAGFNLWTGVRSPVAATETDWYETGIYSLWHLNDLN